MFIVDSDPLNSWGFFSGDVVLPWGCTTILDEFCERNYPSYGS